MNLIEQNGEGTEFSLAYQDNGNFYVSFVNDQGEELHLLNVTDLLQIDTQSTPISGFMEPLITTCFVEGRKVFIQVY